MRGEHVAVGTATDPYQPIEGRYRIMRAILEEFERAATPAHLNARSPPIVRGIDVIARLAARAASSVCVSLPTLDAALARRIEPTSRRPPSVYVRCARHRLRTAPANHSRTSAR